MRVAIVHSWFLSSGGAEATVDALAQLFPEADFFSLFADPKHIPKSLRGKKITTLGLDWLPGKYSYYRHFLPIYPFCFETLDLRGYDLVITSDSSVAKCINTDQATVHICYCYSPMRCLYDQFAEYRQNFGFIPRLVFTLSAHYVRALDFIAAQRVTALVADSHHISERIDKYYRRKSPVIYAPVNTANGYLDKNHDDYYLSVSRLTSPKRIDLLIQACNKLKRRLMVVGAGRDRERLEKMAGPTIEFAGRVSDEDLPKVYARCRALLFSADEDFGIVPVEAQSYGRPVVAYASGGCLETVVEGVTGLFFQKQTVDSLIDGILRFESVEETFVPRRIQEHARRFDTEVFKSAMSKLVQELMGEPNGKIVSFPSFPAGRDVAEMEPARTLEQVRR